MGREILKWIVSIVLVAGLFIGVGYGLTSGNVIVVLITGILFGAYVLFLAKEFKEEFLDKKTF